MAKPYKPGSTHPASGGFAVTPNDTTDLVKPTDALYVGVAGAIKVDMLNGDTITLPTLTAGILHPIRARRIYAAGTTATSIFGFTTGSLM